MTMSIPVDPQGPAGRENRVTLTPQSALRFPQNNPVGKSLLSVPPTDQET
jgi:hypothetical protein